jgi:hypothetical protein
VVPGAGLEEMSRRQLKVEPVVEMIMPPFSVGQNWVEVHG